MNEIELGINVGRVIEAISKIGYNPVAAILDIVDNSVTAKANKVDIIINRDESKTVTRYHSITDIKIIDNGIGMDEEAMKVALSLGSDITYDSGSLSKFGMGLKSASFSLGKTLRIVSKINGQFSRCFELDTKKIKEENKYIVKTIELKELEEDYTAYLPENSGTLVAILDCSETAKDSVKEVLKGLNEKIGVTYYPYFRDEELQVTIGCPSYEKFEKKNVKPFDILFKDLIIENFDPDEYDCLHPYKTFDEEIFLSKEIDKLKLEVVIFPQNRMSNYVGFSEEDRNKIKEYRVSKEYQGFFIYRNGRLIRWGDLLGIINRDLLGFRAIIELDESHDEFFSLDVSKQHLKMPEEIQHELKRLIHESRNSSEEAFRLCSEKYDYADSQNEGNQFNKNNDDFSIEDPLDFGAPNDRIKELVEKTDKVIEETEEGHTENVESNLTELIEESFKKVRYSEKINSGKFLEAHLDSSEGPFVRINKLHSFYDGILREIENESIRQAFEAIFWTMGGAEILTKKNLKDVELEKIEKVFEKFQELFSYNLGSWCGRNQDLMEKK